MNKLKNILAIAALLAVMCVIPGLATAEDHIGAGSISGTKFSDLNNNGLRDKGEPGIEGWTILLFRKGTEGPINKTLTDKDGNYTFTDLNPSNYTVREENRAGWLQTFPAEP